jgi:hypothetical protein
MSTVDTSEMTSISEIADSKDIEYVDEVLELSERAQDYLRQMSWCERILEGWLDYSCGYIIGVFHFHFEPSEEDIPSYVWVIVGDLPPAYLDSEYCKNGTEAMEGYVAEMQKWVDRVMSGRELDDSVIPVNVPPTKEWAEELQIRLTYIKEHFLDEEQ